MIRCHLSKLSPNWQLESQIQTSKDMIEFDTDLSPGTGTNSLVTPVLTAGVIRYVQIKYFYTSLEFKMFDNLLKWVVFQLNNEDILTVCWCKKDVIS